MENDDTHSMFILSLRTRDVLLLSKTIEAPKKRKRTVKVTNTKKKKVEKDDSE